MVIMMTRWSELDLTGRLLEVIPNLKKKKVKVINIPALAYENDPLGRKEGEALWPERYDKEELEEIKVEVGSRIFGALYQGSPAPDEGNIFKRAWWQRYTQYTLPGDFDFRFHSWDMAFKDKKDSDFVVGQVWGVAGKDHYLLDQVRFRGEFTETVKAVYKLIYKWQDYDAILIEDKANGPAVISSLKDEFNGVVPIEPDGSKLARASSVSPMVEAGDVYIPMKDMTPWVNDFVEECAKFPNAAKDDQVDALSQALRYGRKFINALPPSIDAPRSSSKGYISMR
jgi:predicted phage terminase large subunit-like protein